ncbi:hypothetical protein, partial [Vibrio alginolyticus]|uniref:hypothetical protein n=1 Tax=Vibrio alginolyticus TaxID=663 RepID=UPI000B1A2298
LEAHLHEEKYKMLKLSLLAIALFTVVAALGEAENSRCEPNSVFRQACNTCRCANDGSGAVCTRKKCIPDVDSDEPALAR